MNADLYAEYLRRPEALLIMMISSIGCCGALLIWAEIADVERFKTPEKLCSKAGLMPTAHQSGRDLLLRGHQQGGLEEPAVDPHRVSLCEQAVRARFTALQVTCPHREEAREAESRYGSGEEAAAHHLIDAERNERYHGHGPTSWPTCGLDRE